MYKNFIRDSDMEGLFQYGTMEYLGLEGEKTMPAYLAGIASNYMDLVGFYSGSIQLRAKMDLISFGMFSLYNLSSEGYGYLLGITIDESVSSNLGMPVLRQSTKASGFKYMEMYL